MLAVDPDRFDLAAALDHFARLGYARLGRVVTDETIVALGARLDDIMQARAPRDGLFFQHDAESGRYEDLAYGEGWQGPSDDYRKIEKLERDPLFVAFMRNPLYARIARTLIGGPVALYRAVVFNKSARGGTLLPWHQDGGAFWGVTPAPTLQIWTALDDCALDGGCVEVVPETHHGGLVTPHGGVIWERALVAGEAERRALSLPARAGEALLIHNHVWHRSRVNTSGRRRSALSLCLMSADTRCLRKKRAPRQFFRLYE